MPLTEGVIKYEGAGETQGNMGSIPTTPSETHEADDIRPEDSASQVGGHYLGMMSSVGTTKKSLPPPPPPPMSGSPKIARSRPGVPPQTSATSAPMHPPPAPRLPAKFSQDPPPGEVASSSTRPDVVRPKTSPKRPPAKTPPVKSVPKKAKATEPTEIKGSVGRVQPRTPSPKRAVEEMARNDAAARGSAPAKAEAAKAAPAETMDLVTPVSEHGEPPLVSVPGRGRLSAVTVHGPPATSGVSSAAPTPTSPAGDSVIAESTRTELSPLVASSGDITVATDTSGGTFDSRDGGLCGMSREWIAELAGESEVVPTHRIRAAQIGGADYSGRSYDSSSRCCYDSSSCCYCKPRSSW